jgi:glucose/arabinose dehydrogenase
MVRAGGQDGLMGLALHPQFHQGSPYVYISYSYQSLSSTVRKIRIERYTYDSLLQRLISPVTVLENIPGSNDHNSARLAIGPDLKLYYSAGDMGAGQFDNASRTQNAQALNIYEGKILRLNTDTIPGGSWIPADNPFTNAGAPTAVYSFGHRNPQGLVWGTVNDTTILYSSEHGPYSDDEINVIQRGRNYGWPQVAGFCDGNYNGRTIGGFAVVNEQTNCATLNAKEPLRSIFPSENPPTGGDNMAWPSMAPSGTDFYGSTVIPGWQNSLLVAMLKAGTITRYKLSNDGLAIISDTINYFRGLGRFRDVVVSADGLKLYVACDSSGSTSGPTGSVTSTPPNPGSILEFTFSQGVLTHSLKQPESMPAENTRNKTVDVYPNPANQFVVVYNYANERRTISLFDLNGRLVIQQATQQTTRINTGSLALGLYILKVNDAKNKTIRTEKIIIRH